MRLTRRQDKVDKVASGTANRKVMRMSEVKAEDVFARLRWPQTDGKPVYPKCDCQLC